MQMQFRLVDQDTYFRAFSLRLSGLDLCKYATNAMLEERVEHLDHRFLSRTQVIEINFGIL